MDSINIESSIYSQYYERSRELYLKQLYNEELLQNNLSRLQILFTTTKQAKCLDNLKVDFQDVLSCLALCYYKNKNLEGFNRVFLEAASLDIPLSYEVLATYLLDKWENNLLTLSTVYLFTEKIYVIEDFIATFKVSFFADPKLIIPIYNETLHRTNDVLNQIIDGDQFSDFRLLLLYNCQVFLDELIFKRFS
jgi:hypothetical protein